MTTRTTYVIAGASLAGAKAAEALRAVADHGNVPADSIRGHYDQAQQVIEELQDIGIDFDDVMQHLEDDAVTKFDHAWQQLGDQLATALRDPSPGQERSSS